MKTISKTGKWFLKLFLLLSVFTVSVVTVFLLRPEYFIEDIENTIKNKLNIIHASEIDIGSIEGNFVQGFTLTSFTMYQDTNVYFSAQSVYIDPDLSKIFMGSLSMSEVRLQNAFLDLNQQLKGRTGKSKTTPKAIKSSWDFDIQLLHSNKLTVLNESNMINIAGKIALQYSDRITMNIQPSELSSPQLSSPIFITHGEIIWDKSQFSFNTLNVESSWIKGAISGNYIMDDPFNSIGNLQLEYFQYPYGSDSLNIFDVDISIQKGIRGNTCKIKGNLEYSDVELESIELDGIISDSNFIISSTSLIYNGNKLNLNGEIDLETFHWNAGVHLFKYPVVDRGYINGKLHFKTSNDGEAIIGNVNLVDSVIDSLHFSQITGPLTIRDHLISSEGLQFYSDGINGIIQIPSYKSESEFSATGNIFFDNIKRVPYFPELNYNINKGESEFTWKQSKELSEINGSVSLYKGAFLNNSFNSLHSNFDFALSDSNHTTQLSVDMLDWHYAHYNWDSLRIDLLLLDSKPVHLKLSAESQTGDSLAFIAERRDSDAIYVNKLSGQLKQKNLFASPFYITELEDYFHFPTVKLHFAESEIIFSGDYRNIQSYDLSLQVKNLFLDDFYTVVGKKLRIEGILSQGNIDIEVNDELKNPHPLFFSTFLFTNGKIDDISFTKLSLSNSYRNRRFLLNNVALETELGNLEGSGWFNLGLENFKVSSKNEDNLDLSFAFDNMDVVKFNRYLPWGFENRGMMTGTLEISGNVSSPVIAGNFSITDPGFDLISGNKLSGKIYYKNNKLDFRNLSLITENGRYSGFGYIPMDLNMILAERKDISNNSMDFVFTGTTRKFEFLTPYFTMIDSMTYTPVFKDSLKNYSLRLELTGSLKQPVRNGNAVIRNASIYIDPINEPITDINGVFTLRNNHLFVDKLIGNISLPEEPVLAKIPILSSITQFIKDKEPERKNNISLSGSMDLEEFFNPDFALHLTGENVSLSSSYGVFTGKGDMDISVTGKDTILISGAFIPAPYDFTLTSLDTEEDYVVSDSYTSRIVSYDLHVPIQEGIKVETDNINMLLDGDITITKEGDGDYNYSGKADIIDGKFYDNQGNVFQNTYGNILLSPINNIPYIDIHAQTTVDENVIDVSFIGYTDNPVLIFDSQDYTQTEILKMLTFGNSEGFDKPEQAGNILSNYFENEIEKNITRNMYLDEFQLTSKGSLLKNLEGDDDIDLKLVLGKQLSNRIYINTQFDLNNIDNSQYEATYRLNQNTAIVGGLDENNKWHLSYRIKYYY